MHDKYINCVVLLPFPAFVFAYFTFVVTTFHTEPFSSTTRYVSESLIESAWMAVDVQTLHLASEAVVQFMDV